MLRTGLHIAALASRVTRSTGVVAMRNLTHKKTEPKPFDFSKAQPLTPLPPEAISHINHLTSATPLPEICDFSGTSPSVVLPLSPADTYSYDTLFKAADNAPVADSFRGGTNQIATASLELTTCQHITAKPHHFSLLGEVSAYAHYLGQTKPGQHTHDLLLYLNFINGPLIAGRADMREVSPDIPKLNLKKEEGVFKTDSIFYLPKEVLPGELTRYPFYRILHADIIMQAVLNSNDMEHGALRASLIFSASRSLLFKISPGLFNPLSMALVHTFTRFKGPGVKGCNSILEAAVVAKGIFRLEEKDKPPLPLLIVMARTLAEKIGGGTTVVNETLTSVAITDPDHHLDCLEIPENCDQLSQLINERVTKDLVPKTVIDPRSLDKFPEALFK